MIDLFKIKEDCQDGFLSEIYSEVAKCGRSLFILKHLQTRDMYLYYLICNSGRVSTDFPKNTPILKLELEVDSSSKYLAQFVEFEAI